MYEQFGSMNTVPYRFYIDTHLAGPEAALVSIVQQVAARRRKGRC